MKRALALLVVPCGALLAAALLHRSPAAAPHPATAKAATTARTAEPTWVSVRTEARVPARRDVTAAAKIASGPKPPTPSRTALQESQVPVVATLSIDRLGSPRERLFAENHGPSEAREAQLDRLSDRTRAHLARLKEARAHATGEERKHLDQSILAMQRNQSFRDRILTATVHGDARPGTSIQGR